MGKFLTDVDLNQNELQYAVIQNLNTDPIVSTTGQIYYNTNISKLRLKTPAGWITIATGSITIPTLQQVTTAGAITTDVITVAGIYSGNLYSDGFSFGISDNNDTNYNLLYQPFSGLEITNTSDHVYIYQDASIGFQNFAGGYGNLRSDLVTGSWSWQLPNASGTLALTSNIPTVGTWGALNYPTWMSGTPFVKMTAAGTFALDTTTYYPYPTGTISQYIRGDGTLATLPSGTTPTLQQVTNTGNTTTNDIKIGTGSGGTGTYFLLQPNGFENYFAGGYNLSTPTFFQIRRENTSSSSIYSLLSVQENSISSGSYNLTDSSQISVFPTQVSIGVQDNPLTGQYGINVYKNRINFTALIGSLGKSINLLLDYTAVNSNIYFPASGGTLALLSDIPTGFITGSGTVNYLPKFTSSNSIGNSPHTTTSQVLTVNDSGRPFINSGTVRLSIQRAQSQIDFNCGNPGFNEPSSIISDNQTDGFEILSKGELALKTGATYTNEGLRLLSTGKLKFTQTPDTGTTSDFILLRDTSGNVKQIAGNTYVTTANSTLQNAYNNSADGKILLDLTRGGIKVQAITGITNTIESYGIGATTPNFYVDPSGNPFGNYFYATWFNTPFGSGLEDNSGTVRLNSAYDGIVGQGRWESNQRINYLADYSALYSNRSLIDKGYADTTYVPKTRTLTINGTAYDLTADRSWSVGTVTSVGATSPITSTGGTTPVISTSMATNKLIGRSSAGTGVMEEITIGTGLSLSGGVLDVTATGGIPHATASGTDTYTATVSGVTAYNDADAYLIRFTNGNTTGATLNINGLGAIPLYRNNDGALIGGDIISGGEMICVYNSATTSFQVIGTSPNSLFAYVTNADSVTLTKGMPVYAFSGTGDRMTVKRAYNTLDATSAQTVGLVLSTSIAANQKGLIMMQGLLDGLSILPTSTFADGDPVYLGATAGTITKVKPYAPNHLVYLGVVTTANNGSAGRMYVRVQNGYELDELHNVQAQNPTLKDTLWYDNTVSPAQWKTASISTILGYTPFNLPSLTSGSVLFSNGTTIAQDNANFFWDDTNNRLGLGTTSPSSRLHVDGSMHLQNSATGIESITFSNGPQIEANGPVGYFKTGQVYTNTITSNVGIGTSTPSYKLNLYGSTALYNIGTNSAFAANTNYFIGHGLDASTPGNITSKIGFISDAGVGQFSDAIAFYTTPTTFSPVNSDASTERMRITNSGNVGIGTSTPNASAILDLTSTTQGLLIPRMTTAERNAISSPATGLIVYDITLLSLYQYNGTAWTAVGGGVGGTDLGLVQAMTQGLQNIF